MQDKEKQEILAIEKVELCDQCFISFDITMKHADISGPSGQNNHPMAYNESIGPEIEKQTYK